MTARSYSPRGKCHRMLACLDAGPATSAELAWAATGQNATATRRKKARLAIRALAEDGLVTRIAQGFWARTHAGDAALHQLRRGLAVETRQPWKAAA